MKHPSREQFRIFAATGIALQLLGAVLESLRIPPQAQEINDALDWNYYGAVIPFETLNFSWWVLHVPAIVAFIAFLFFRPWSRPLLALLLLAGIGLLPLEGLHVFLGIYDVFLEAGTLLLLIPLVLSFFSPCSNYFEPVATGQQSSTSGPV